MARVRHSSDLLGVGNGLLSAIKLFGVDPGGAPSCPALLSIFPVYLPLNGLLIAFQDFFGGYIRDGSTDNRSAQCRGGGHSGDESLALPNHSRSSHFVRVKAKAVVLTHASSRKYGLGAVGALLRRARSVPASKPSLATRPEHHHAPDEGERGTGSSNVYGDPQGNDDAA